MIKSKNKCFIYYNIIIYTKVISISDILNKISKRVKIDDVGIENESIDNLIVKLYEDYKI